MVLKTICTAGVDLEKVVLKLWGGRGFPCSLAQGCVREYLYIYDLIVCENYDIRNVFYTYLICYRDLFCNIFVLIILTKKSESWPSA